MNPTDPPERSLELWLVRHAETDWNRERRTQGHSPNPLSALGRAQALRLGVRLAEVTFDHFDCSDLERARETAALALPGRSYRLEPRLREVSRGIFEGRTLAELNPEERVFREAMARDRLNVRPEGGENFRDVKARVGAWLAGLPRSGRMLALTHGGVLHAVLHGLLGHAEDWDSLLSFSNTGITELRLGGARTLIVRVNDCAHLEGRSSLLPNAAD